MKINFTHNRRKYIQSHENRDKQTSHTRSQQTNQTHANTDKPTSRTRTQCHQTVADKHREKSVTQKNAGKATSRYTHKQTHPSKYSVKPAGHTEAQTKQPMIQEDRQIKHQRTQRNESLTHKHRQINLSY